MLWPFQFLPRSCCWSWEFLNYFTTNRRCTRWLKFSSRKRDVPNLFFNSPLFWPRSVHPFLKRFFFVVFAIACFEAGGARPAAMGISASLFAGIHGSGFAFFPIFILGLALAWLYEKRGNLGACWTFHVLHNILFTGYFLAAKAILGAVR